MGLIIVVKFIQHELHRIAQMDTKLNGISMHTELDHLGKVAWSTATAMKRKTFPIYICI